MAARIIFVLISALITLVKVNELLIHIRTYYIYHVLKFGTLVVSNK